MWFNCSEGPLNDGPEVSVGIKEEFLEGNTTLNLHLDGGLGKILVKTENGDVYQSSGSATNCYASFGTESTSTFEFGCSDMPKEDEIGGSTVTVSDGVFSL